MKSTAILRQLKNRVVFCGKRSQVSVNLVVGVVVIDVDRDVGRNRGRVCGRLELLVLLHAGTLLQLVVVDDVLVGRTRLRERVQLIHVIHIPPDVDVVFWDLEVGEVLACSMGQTRTTLVIINATL